MIQKDEIPDLIEARGNSFEDEYAIDYNCNTAIPELCESINRGDTMNKCLEVLTRTKTTGCKHKTCVWVICDCFIIGTEKLCWISEDQLKVKEEILSVKYLEQTVQKKFLLNFAIRTRFLTTETLKI